VKGEWEEFGLFLGHRLTSVLGLITSGRDSEDVGTPALVRGPREGCGIFNSRSG